MEHPASEETPPESPACFQALFEGVPLAMVLLDPARRIRQANRRFTDLVLRDREAVLGVPVEALVDPEDAATLVAWLAGEPVARPAGRLEVRLPRADGGLEWRLLEVTPLPCQGGGPPLRMLSFERACSRHQAETPLQRARKMEALSRLAGGVAHDFNNLLTAVLGYSGLLRGRLGPGAQGQAGLEEVMQASRRASALTQQLLALGRRHFGDPEPVRLASVVEDLLEMLGRMCGETVDLRLDLGAPEAWVLGDRTQLEQVVLNLALNARDAMPRGGVMVLGVHEGDAPPRPGLPTLAPGRYAVLTVADEGEGMDEAVQAQLFEPFFTTRAPGRGTGLGLPTVYGIVTQGGGAVSVRSAVGKGSTFFVHLPLTDRRPPRAATPDPLPELERPLRILLVEDDPMIQRLVPRLLQGRGWQVHVARTGEEALALRETLETPVDLVISDVVLPGLGGVEVVQRLRERWTRVPVLFISGLLPDAELRRRVERQEVHFLAKPFTSEGLADEVRRSVDRAGRSHPPPRG